MTLKGLMHIHAAEDGFPAGALTAIDLGRAQGPVI
jgi:hypothetical protein